MFGKKQVMLQAVIEEAKEEGTSFSQQVSHHNPILSFNKTELKTISKLKELIQRSKISLEHRSLKYRYNSTEYHIDSDQDVVQMVSNFQTVGSNVLHKIQYYTSFKPPIPKLEYSSILQQNLSNRYNRTVVSIGSGGNGFVFEIQPANEKEKAIAVKVTLQGEHSNMNAGLGEARNSLIAIHPHVVRIGNIFALEKVKHLKTVMCIEMERLQGSLTSVFISPQKKRILSDRIAVMIINQVCQAFQACLEQKIIHRDVKPDNILVKSITEDGIHIVLSDFGHAVSTSSFNAGSFNSPIEIGGTIKYQAPEVRQDFKTFSMESEIFSLGITMYFLVIGRVLDENGANLCENLDKVEYRLEKSNASKFVIQLIVGMIQKDAKERISLEVLLRLTSEFLNSSKISFKLVEDSNSFRIDLPYYPKFNEVKQIIKKKIEHENFEISYKQDDKTVLLVTKDSESNDMMKILLSKEPKERIIVLKLPSIENLTQNASQFYQNGNYDQALQLLKQISRRIPFSVTILTKIAYCYCHLGKYKQALENFTMIKQMNGVGGKNQQFDSKFNERFAYCYLQTGEVEKANEIYEENLSTGDYRMYFNAGICAKQLKEYERSIRLFEKSYLLNRGRGNLEAIKNIASIIAEYMPDNPLIIHSIVQLETALFSLGLYYQNEKNMEECKIQLQEALKLSPSDENIKNALKSIQP